MTCWYEKRSAWSLKIDTICQPNDEDKVWLYELHEYKDDVNISLTMLHYSSESHCTCFLLLLLLKDGLDINTSCLLKLHFLKSSKKLNAIFAFWLIS